MARASRRNGRQATPVEQMFNDLYSRTDRYWWRRPDPYDTSPEAYTHSRITKATLEVIDRTGVPPGARALDLGAGEGADAIRLARLGYQVMAVEISEIGLGKIARYAAEAGEQIELVWADLTDYQPDGMFDVIICNGVLHYIEDKMAVLERMQAATRPGGFNVVSLWSTHSEVPRPHLVVPVFSDDEDGDVTKSYSGWDEEYLYFDQNKPETSHETEEPHVHSHIKLIGSKPADQWRDLPTRGQQGPLATD